MNRFLWAAGLSLVAWAADAAEVRLRSSAGCAASLVRLGDVAEILGDDARTAGALAEIPLCPAPAAGCQRSLSQHDVRQLLALSGVERSVATVTGSDAVTVTGESSRLAVMLPRRPLVASGIRQAIFEAEAPPAQRSARQRPAPQAPALAAQTVPSAMASAVERGTALTVHARAAGVRVTTSGKALDDGGIGETIGVELADSKQRILAKVIGSQAVEVSPESGTVAAHGR